MTRVERLEEEVRDLRRRIDLAWSVCSYRPKHDDEATERAVDDLAEVVMSAILTSAHTTSSREHIESYMGRTLESL